MHILRIRRRRQRSCGFTLVELMTVVAITGILAAIGVSLVRGHLDVARANRALTGIQNIRVAEEAFRAQNGQYLDCSGTAANWFPMINPGKVLYNWRQDSTHPDGMCWRNLAIPRDAGTQFGFLVNAGNPSQAYPLLQTAQKPVLPPPTDYWYVIQVKGDIDGDNVPMLGFATSMTGEVYVEHEGE